MNKEWKIFSPTKEQEKLIENISEKYKISKILSTIMVAREIGIKDGKVIDEDIEIFLKPTRYSFHDPFEMPDMEKAVDRIIKAIENKESICIYGDYDVDGITSITVLKRFLLDRGAIVTEYIPNRLKEGYGLNIDAIEKIAKDKTNLIITVDTGITGEKEIKRAVELGMEVIVTDHHEEGDEFPSSALAVIDCKRKDNKYCFRELSGVGVAFKLTQAISMKMKIKDNEYLKRLDIVAIGTIADIVPLKDENRVITKLGLLLLNQTKNPGLKALIQLNNLTNIDSTQVGFIIGPRINACGRMGYEKEALKLLLTDDIEEAKETAIRLNEYNQKRQDYEKNIFEEAEKKYQEELKEKKKVPMIILEGENWHHGIIGIVASKMTDKYFKPSILLCKEKGEELEKGSGRSIPGFDLHEALINNQKEIEKFGGHSMAIGLTLQKDKFEKFKKNIFEYSQKKGIYDIINYIFVDEKIDIKDVTIETAKELKILEPYGEQNLLPLFEIKDLKISSIRTLTEGKHLKLSLSKDNKIIDAIGFGLGEYEKDFVIGDKINIIGNLSINEFNGNQKIQIILKDIKKV